MNILSRKTTLSLVQYLALQDRGSVGLLCEKHGLPYNNLLSALEAMESYFTQTLADSVTQAGQDQIYALLDEVLRTRGDLRSRVVPKYRHDQRFDDLARCLALDGFVVEGDKLVPQDPTILDAPSVEDDLTHALQSCGLQGADDVRRKLQDSTDAFRNTPPNFNASLNDARVALQTLATSIALTRVAKHSSTFDEKKWGAVLEYLHNSGFLTADQEKGLAGVFRFISPGSHLPMELSEMEMARLGRSFVAGMCWFMIKRFIHERS